MIISITGGNHGWSNYVLDGTKSKPRIHSKIKILRGNLEIGDTITNATNYRQNIYSIVLSFMGKPTLKIINNVLDEFEKYFMHGFSKKEYHLDAVAHFDTDDYHVHIRIPKLNLLTQTQLQLYLDKKDRKRINLIRDVIDLKYGLENPNNKRQLIKDKPDFSQQFSKNAQNDLISIMLIYDYLRELHQANIIENLNDVKQELRNINLIIIDNDYDFSRDCYYLTIQLGNKKIRLKGDLFNEKFWKFSREDRSKQILSNRQYRGVLERSKENYKRVCDELQLELKKRREEIIKRYSTSRERAHQRVNFTSQKTQKSFTYSKESPRKKGTTGTQDNVYSFSIAYHTYWNGKLLLTKNTSLSQIIRYQKVKKHNYTLEQYFTLRYEIKKILHKGKHESNNRDITEQSQTIRREREKTTRLSSTERDFIYRKATKSLQNRRDTAGRRERYRKKIDFLRARCAETERKFDSNFTKISAIIRNITTETDTSVGNTPDNEPLTTEEYGEEVFNFNR